MSTEEEKAPATTPAETTAATTATPAHTWNQWLIKWHECLQETTQGNSSIFNAQCSTQCETMPQCPCFRRILFLMQFYQQFQFSADHIKVIFACFNTAHSQTGYNLVTLLDDYHHLLYCHKHNDAHFQLMFAMLQQHYACNIRQCTIIRRHHNLEHIDHDSDAFWKRFEDELAEISAIQILDQVHASLYHSYDLYRFTPQERDSLLAANDDADGDDGGGESRDPSYYARFQKLLQPKYEHLKLLKREHTRKTSLKFCSVAISKSQRRRRQDDEKVMYDSDDNEIRSTTRRKRNQSEFVGFRFYYDERLSHKSDTKYATLVKKKFSSLQREVCNNKFVKLDLNDFNQAMNNAQLYLYCRQGRKYTARSSRSLDLECVVALLLYCNFEQLQTAFKQSYTLWSKDEDDFEEAALRHREFVNWAMLLNRAVNEFGTRVNDAKQARRTYYHALVAPSSNAVDKINNNKKSDFLDFNFNESVFRFYGPLLMSTRVEVVHQFMRARDNSNGMILGLSAHADTHGACLRKCLDCAWLSAFEYEESTLCMHHNKFVDSEYMLRITAAIDVAAEENFGDYFSAISVLREMINNTAIDAAQTHTAVFSALGELMSRRLRPIAYSNKRDAYIDAIFARFCQLQNGILCVDMHKLLALSLQSNSAAFCRNYLISSTQNKSIFVLKCHNFVELFSSTPSIEIKNGCLNSIMFELIYQSLKFQEHRIDLQRIEFSNINEEQSELTPSGIVAAYNDKFDAIAWTISYDQEFKLVKLQKLQYMLLTATCKIWVSIFNNAFYFGNAQKKTQQVNAAAGAAAGDTTSGGGDGVKEEEVKTQHGVYQVKVVNEEAAKQKHGKIKQLETWMVDKRYSDFLALHKWFNKKRNGIKSIDTTHVKFPPKTLFRKPNTTTVMEERRDQFENYMRYLLRVSIQHDNKLYLKKLSHFLSPNVLKEIDDEDNDDL